MRDWIGRLEREGELLVVEREVDGRFELAAVTAAAQQTSDAALLFRRVRGTALPVITNLYGSRRRLGQMIGLEHGPFCRHFRKRARTAAQGMPVVQAAVPPRRPAALSELPAITYFEKDAGPYITAGIFLAKDPETGVGNLSFHRAMHVDDGELRIRLGASHDLCRYQSSAEGRGAPLEAVMLIGAPPCVTLAAAAPIETDADELELAAKLLGAPLAMAPCDTVGLAYPASTEIVVEGRILPNLRRPEGPFGEFMGYYVPQADNHVFEVSAVHVREDAYYHGILCGSPEDLRLLELAVATQIYDHLVARLPGIVDVSCVPNVMNTVVKIRKAYEGHPRQVLLSAVGANHDWSKSCMVVDEDVDIDDFDDVYWAFLTRGRADRRAQILHEVPGFYRDPHQDYWGRLLIDATKPWGREQEFERKRIPGADTVDLANYLA